MTAVDWGTLPAEPLSPFPGTVHTLGGRDIFVREAGEPGGEPAVFVHGLGGSSTNWTDLMALLGDRLHGRALDLPGFGQSAPTRSGRYPLDVHAAAVIALLETLDGPAHLFGNSLGGATATRVAARRPELVKTLTLVSPALPDLKPRGDIDWRLPLIYLPLVGPRLQAKLAAQTPEQRVMGTMRLVYFDVSRVPEQRIAEAAEEVVRRDALGYSDATLKASLRGLVAAQARPGPANLWAEASRVQAPTLLVWGRHDKLVNVRVATRAVRTFPDSSLVVYDDAAHVAQMERPERVARDWHARFGA